jgi:transposase-like protein
MMLTEAQQDEIARGLVARARVEGAELVGPDGVLSGLTKRVLETALEEELTDHLGYEPHDPAGHHSGNSRNGTRAKTVLTEIGPVQVDVPRDRAGTFEPVIVPKGKRRLEGVDRIVLSLTARGLTTGEISAHFAEVYGASIAKDTISRISDRVIEEMTEWLHRPLDEGRFPVILANPELEGSQCHVEDTTEHQLRPSVATSS